MDRRPDRRLSGEAGLATIENVVVAGLSLLFFAVLTNLVVMQYALGVATAALDEGARQDESRRADTGAERRSLRL